MYDIYRNYIGNIGYVAEFWRIRTMGKKPSPKTSLSTQLFGTEALRGETSANNVTFEPIVCVCWPSMKIALLSP